MTNVHSSHFHFKVKKVYLDQVTHTASTLNMGLLKNPHRALKITFSSKSEAIYSSNWEFSKTYFPHIPTVSLHAWTTLAQGLNGMETTLIPISSACPRGDNDTNIHLLSFLSILQSQNMGMKDQRGPTPKDFTDWQVPSFFFECFSIGPATKGNSSTVIHQKVNDLTSVNILRSQLSKAGRERECMRKYVQMCAQLQVAALILKLETAS